MVKSLFGGSEFLSKVLPATNLDTKFQFEQCQSVMETINEVKNGKVFATSADGSKLDRRLLRIFNPVSSKPWLIEGNTYFYFTIVCI